MLKTAEFFWFQVFEFFFCCCSSWRKLVLLHLSQPTTLGSKKLGRARPNRLWRILDQVPKLSLFLFLALLSFLSHAEEAAKDSWSYQVKKTKIFTRHRYSAAMRAITLPRIYSHTNCNAAKSLQHRCNLQCRNIASCSLAVICNTTSCSATVL